MFYFHPDPWGDDPMWRVYFSNGLKPPTGFSTATFFLVKNQNPKKLYMSHIQNPSKIQWDNHPPYPPKKSKVTQFWWNMSASSIGLVHLLTWRLHEGMIFILNESLKHPSRVFVGLVSISSKKTIYRIGFRVNKFWTIGIRIGNPFLGNPVVLQRMDRSLGRWPTDSNGPWTCIAVCHRRGGSFVSQKSQNPEGVSVSAVLAIFGMPGIFGPSVFLFVFPYDYILLEIL